MKILIYIPLTVIVILSLLSLTGLGETQLGGLYLGGNPDDVLYYDYYGHPVAWANLTAYGEKGIFINSGGDASWFNGTGFFDAFLSQTWTLWWDENNEYRLSYEDLGKTQPSSKLGDIDLTATLGFIALVVGIMALALLAGLKIFGSGTSNSMVLVLGTAYLAVWGVFSVLAINLLNEITITGGIIYFILNAALYVGDCSVFSRWLQ